MLLTGMVTALRQEIDKAYHAGNSQEVANNFSEIVVPSMANLRSLADEIEMLVDDVATKLPKYRELFFLR